MELKKLHMGTIVFGWDSMDEVNHLLAQTFGESTPSSELVHLYVSVILTGSPRKPKTERFNGGTCASRSKGHVFACP